MNTLTVLAREVQPGDLVDFGGHRLEVEEVDQEPGGQLATIWVPDGRGNMSDLTLQADAQLVIQRPDPDPEVELVDSAAAAWMAKSVSGWQWETASSVLRDDYRTGIRGVLDSIRSAGYQVVKV